jgi:hypothetical protein
LYSAKSPVAGLAAFGGGGVLNFFLGGFFDGALNLFIAPG